MQRGCPATLCDSFRIQHLALLANYYAKIVVRTSQVEELRLAAMSRTYEPQTQADASSRAARRPLDCKHFVIPLVVVAALLGGGLPVRGRLASPAQPHVAAASSRAPIPT